MSTVSYLSIYMLFRTVDFSAVINVTSSIWLGAAAGNTFIFQCFGHPILGFGKSPTPHAFRSYVLASSNYFGVV